MAVAGKVLFEDDFARADMTPKWKVGKGFFEIKDGTVSVAANATIQRPRVRHVIAGPQRS